MKKTGSAESGLIDALRLFVGIRLLFSLLPMVSQYLALRLRIQRIQPGHPLLSLLETGILLGYLSIPWLRSKLGKAYLPLALAAVTLGPLLEYYLSVDRRLADEVSQARAVAGQWQLTILLLMPLILLSWKYAYKMVILYTAALWAVDTLFYLPFLRILGVSVWALWSVIWFRSGVFLLIGYVINRLVSEQRKQTAQLAEVNRQLSAANRQLSDHAATMEQLVVSRERNRLARELHDTLAHTLSGVAVELEAVSALWDGNADRARGMLQEALEQTRSGLKEARRAIQSLRAAPLDDLGLAGALRTLAQTTAERTGMALTLQVEEDLPVLGTQAEHGLYRVAEEALRNVEKHARASRVSVSLGVQGKHLLLVVQDNGRGFDAQAGMQIGHFGLAMMQERAEAIGAELSVESSPGGGAVVRLAMEIRDDTHLNL